MTKETQAVGVKVVREDVGKEHFPKMARWAKVILASIRVYLSPFFGVLAEADEDVFSGSYLSS
jgi:hypothetical protein